ncbi:hypothetical protein ACWEFJ_25885 [Actinosynnema sp. NPDC004786]
MPAEEQLRVAALLKAVLDEFDARSAARVSEHADRGVDGLKAALLSDAEHTMAHRGLATPHVVLQAEHLAGDGEVRARFVARNRALRRAFAERLGPDRATELLAFPEGALTLWLLDPETVDLRAPYEGYLRRL